MRALTVYVDVRDLARQGVGARRVAGVIDGGEKVAVASILDGDRVATPELEFSFADALTLAEACLSGDRRALTTPGLARYLSAAVAVLFRVSCAAGALQRQGDFDGGDAGYLDNRTETGPDEDPD
ncbi:hypothetical protein P9272_13770 [Mesorhizobium sp. WSM4976]|uniref:hypothetical protein n=1 Tax=Mesorhizobium sp. WSM4976 TaxID=3038549 RepID=UPI0024172B9A|nr:hypothetical protein [Mesorhizobium sp. WSM4976]MDG4894641.1 hypothetical protein [Mesorhizobium sp. WSM4976]